MARFIVKGQLVDPAKSLLAREFRRWMTPDERALWSRLKTNQLGGFHFRRQQVIHGFIVDFYCHAAGVIVEVDGDVHQEQKSADEERDAILKSLGLCILRVTNIEVLENMEDVLKRIMDMCVPRK